MFYEVINSLNLTVFTSKVKNNNVYTLFVLSVYESSWHITGILLSHRITEFQRTQTDA